MKKGKKNRTKIYLIVGILLTCLVGILLFVFLNDSNENNNGNNLDVSYENDKTVLISNRLPMTDLAGMQLTGEGTKDDIQGYVEFSIKSTTDKKQEFSIYLKERKVNVPINDRHVRLYLTDFNNNPYDGFKSNIIPCYEDFKVLKDSPSDKILFSGVLNGNEKKNFRLRVWVSDTYTLRDSEETFSFDVKVKGE